MIAQLPRKRKRELALFAAPFFEVTARVLSVLPETVRTRLLTLVRGVTGYAGLSLRYVLVRSLAEDIGQVVAIYEDVYIRHVSNLVLGSNVSIWPMTYIDALGGVEIGNDVSIAHSCSIISFNHGTESSSLPFREAPLSMSKVKIGSNVWIGAGVRIMAGVSLGDDVVIGSGAVVTKDIPSNSVAVGVPAMVIKQVRQNT